MNLVAFGYGSYEDAANADLVEAVLFMYLRTKETVNERIHRLITNDRWEL